MLRNTQNVEFSPCENHIVTFIYSIEDQSALIEVWAATCCPKLTNSSIFLAIFDIEEPSTLVERTTKSNKISYLNTSTTHKSPLYYYSAAQNGMVVLLN